MHVRGNGLGARQVAIDEHELARTGTQRDRHGCRGTHRADADNPEFHDRSLAASGVGTLWPSG